MSLASLKATSEKVETEIPRRVRPAPSILTAISGDENEYCLIKDSVPQGVVCCFTAPRAGNILRP